MKKTFSAFVFAGAAFAMLASQAIAATTTPPSHHHLSHKAHVAKHHKSHKHHRHNPYVHRVYGRPGPLYGYRFGFSTYPGDPFYSDDYFDGRRCYYLHHKDFCRGPKSLDWLRW
jgi:hypothetical protein